MGRLRNAARKVELLRLQTGGRDPRVDRVSRLFGDLKLHRALGFLLHHNRAGRDMTALDHIVDAKPDQIAPALRYPRMAPLLRERSLMLISTDGRLSTRSSPPALATADVPEDAGRRHHGAKTNAFVSAPRAPTARAAVARHDQ